MDALVVLRFIEVYIYCYKQELYIWDIELIFRRKKFTGALVIDFERIFSQPLETVESSFLIKNSLLCT